MKRSYFRAAALALTGTVVAGLLAASPASALQTVAGTNMGPLLGQGTLVPATGPLTAAPRATTTVGCPANSSWVDVYVDSTAAGLSGAVATGSDGTALGTLTTTGVAFGLSLIDTAATQGKTVVNGTYDVTIGCSDGFGGYLGHFDLSFTVTGGATATSVGTTYAFNAPALPTTTTNLTVSPAGPVSLGASVTLTANVSATGATPAGTVQFKSGTTNVGTPVTVAAGVATLTTAALPAGANQALTAVFTPATPATTQGSTSNTVTFTVNAPAQATTLALASSPAAPTTADVVSLTASVSSATPVNVGTVTFTETTTPAVPAQTATVVNGVASVSLVGLTAGTHTFSASYADAGTPQQFLASGPATVTVTVTAFAGATGSETVTTTVGVGTITLTATGTVALGQLNLNAANTLLVSNPVDINTVTVSDTRAGNLGFTVSGQVTDFTRTGGAGTITGDNLGWTPKVLTQPGTGIVAGPVVAPGVGLKTSKVLATAPAGVGFGTSTYSATLLLQAPTSTPAGNYSATLTLTAL